MPREAWAIIDKYLAHYQEPLPEQLKEVAKFGIFDFVVVIPAYREREQFVDHLRAFMATQKTPVLVIVVVNGPDNNDDTASENAALYNLLLTMGPIAYQKGSLCFVKHKTACLMILGPFVLPRREGVGRARKIGCDAALSLIRQGTIKNPLLFSTDADAILPSDYVLRVALPLAEHPATSCFIYPFKHERPSDLKERRAIELYDLRLLHYVNGLRSAGSPYAFFTIGSTLAIHALAYARVRGFPKLAGGEDFYLLNKLAKVGEIHQLNGDAIKLSARLSTRVPFGTGPSLIRLIEDGDYAPIFYDPSVFVQLRGFLANKVAALCSTLPPKKDDAVDDALNEEAFRALRGNDSLDDTLRKRSSEQDRVKTFHDWFDGFRTLKFIHFLRDTRFPMRSFDELSQKRKLTKKSYKRLMDQLS